MQVLISRLTYLLIFLLLTTTRFFSCFTGASRACAALIAFLTRSVATSGFSSKSMLNAQIQWHQLKNALHLYLVSLRLPFKLKHFFRTRTETIAATPSRISVPSKFLSFSFNSATLRAYSLNTRVIAVLNPASCVPPSFVRTLFTNDKMFSE